VSDNNHGSLEKIFSGRHSPTTSHSASKVNVLMLFKYMGITKPLHVRRKHVGMTLITTEVKHRTVNVSKAFVITRRFIGSVGTGSGNAKCKHCLDVNTHTHTTYDFIRNALRNLQQKKRLIKPLYKNKKISNQRRMSSVRPLLSLERQSVEFGHQTR
jgi:hypothetical protein